MRLLICIAIMSACACRPLSKDLRTRKASESIGTYDSTVAGAKTNIAPNISKLTEYCAPGIVEGKVPGQTAFLQMTAAYQFANCDAAVSFFAKSTELDFSGIGLTDITPLQYLPQLQRLNLNDNRIGDLAPLKDHGELKYLEIARNGLTDITPLKSMTGMIELGLSENALVDISVLAGLK